MASPATADPVVGLCASVGHSDFTGGRLASFPLRSPVSQTIPLTDSACWIGLALGGRQLLDGSQCMRLFSSDSAALMVHNWSPHSTPADCKLASSVMYLSVLGLSPACHKRGNKKALRSFSFRRERRAQVRNQRHRHCGLVLQLMAIS